VAEFSRDDVVDLETGTTGIAVALHEYLKYREDSHFTLLRDHIRDSLDVELMTSSTLLRGRAGLVSCLAHMGGDTELHLRQLAVHAVGFHGHLAFPMDGMERLSMDLATGTAGVLLAVHLARTGGNLPILGT
jgi:hypothetical protein